MKRISAIIWIAACAISTGASSQNSLDAPAPCPSPAEIGPQHLYGSWRARLDGQTEATTVVFEKHPELAGSVSGHVTRAGVRAQIAGDVDEGEFTLEESLDGEHIAATWLGTVVATSCGKEIRGTWNNTLNNTTYPFILRKQPGW